MAITCRDFERLWNELLDARDGATMAAEEELEAHAETCARCRATSLRYQALRQALRAWGPPPAPSADFSRRFSERRDLPSPSRVPRANRPTSKTTLLAIAASLLLAALLALRDGGGPDDGRRSIGPPAPAEAPRPLADSLADATSATWALARATSEPAARIGMGMLGVGAMSDASRVLPAPEAISLLPSSGGRSTVGDRVGDGVHPLTGSARHAFGFLLGPALDADSDVDGPGGT